MRATYLYSGMADVAALTGDEAYVKALDRIWDDVVGKKLYLTGGIGVHQLGRGLRARLRAAQHERVQRDLRRHRQRLLEPPPVPAPRRRPLHRRHGADPLQRPPLRRLPRRQVVLLSQPARVGRPAPAQPVVRRRLLSGEHDALPGLRARLRLRAAGRLAVRQPLRGQHRRREDGRRPHGRAGPGDALSLGRRGEDHRAPGQARAVRDERARPRLGARRSAAGRPLSVRRHVDRAGDAQGQRPVRPRRSGEGLRADRPVAGRPATWSSCRCPCPSAA